MSNLKTYLNLFKTECFFAFKNYVRYPFNSLIPIVVLFLVFLTLYQASATLAGNQVVESTNLAKSLVIFICWSIVVTAFSSIASGIEEFAKLGTLEQVMVNGLSYPTLAFFKGIITAGITLANNFLLLGLLCWWYELPLPVHSAMIGGIIALGISAIGIGLVFGAFALLTKQSGTLINLIQFLLLPLFFVHSSTKGIPSVEITWLIPAILPLKSILNGLAGVSMSHLDLWAWGSSLVFLGLGLLTLTGAIQWARKKGLIYLT